MKLNTATILLRYMGKKRARIVYYNPRRFCNLTTSDAFANICWLKNTLEN